MYYDKFIIFNPRNLSVEMVAAELDNFTKIIH